MNPLTWLRIGAGAALVSMSALLAPAAYATEPIPTTNPTSAPASPAPAAAQGPVAANVTVTITDTTFSPASVNVAQGGTVTWTNSGGNVHTATSSGTVPAGFDTGGIGPSQSGSWVFTQPGAYTYSSETDCLNGNISQTFQCGTYTVNVVPPGSPAPATSPTGGQVQNNATISISDSGFSTHALTITQGGTVNVVNNGQQVHTLTTTGTAPTVLDTGGLANAQSHSFVMSLPGSYPFSSATDCLRGNVNPVFDCTTVNTITVTTAPPGATNLTAPSIGSILVYIHDDTGFDPTTKTVPAGSTVTWLNLGQNAHSVQSDSGVNPPFDSGGISEGGTFSVTFSQPGTYTYHSAADPVFSGTTQTGYKFSGTIVVQ
ncbi:MAG TPA: hypothetical protein VFS62_09160 [Chloroflexota bacterium]|nr:hypothetical protein [Chloroflexota bacterium]